MVVASVADRACKARGGREALAREPYHTVAAVPQCGMGLRLRGRRAGSCAAWHAPHGARTVRPPQ
jgi:hypothetical protein